MNIVIFVLVFIAVFAVIAYALNKFCDSCLPRDDYGTWINSKFKPQKWNDKRWWTDRRYRK